MRDKNNIALIGMMGSGKSTIGRLMAKKLNKKFIDIDRKIEDLENKKIGQIFELKGEDFFRNLEFKVSSEYLRNNNSIISLGGGAFLNHKLRKIIKQNSISFWLYWASDILIKRLKSNTHRPIIKEMNDSEIKKMILKRNKVYAKSDFKIVCCNQKKNEIVSKIVYILKKNEIIN